jgi:hypothetical protein
MSEMSTWGMYGDDDVLSLDEFIEAFAQLGLHVPSQTAKGESMALSSVLGRRDIMSSF